MIKLDRLKYGKRNALTLSYDDGFVYDLKLVEILNENGIRATFHLNSGNLDRDNIISSEEVKELYKNHEVMPYNKS